MSGFYYRIKLVDFELTDSQLRKVRDYLRDKIRSVAAIDSGRFLNSLKTRYYKDSKILTVYSELNYSGYIEGGNKNYITHKSKVGKALSSMGLKPAPIQYF